MLFNLRKSFASRAAILFFVLTLLLRNIEAMNGRKTQDDHTSQVTSKPFAAILGGVIPSPVFSDRFLLKRRKRHDHHRHGHRYWQRWMEQRTNGSRIGLSAWDRLRGRIRDLRRNEGRQPLESLEG